MKQNRLICSQLRLLTTFLPPLERQCIPLRRFTAIREAYLSNLFSVFPIFKIDSPATPNYCLGQTLSFAFAVKIYKCVKEQQKNLVNSSKQKNFLFHGLSSATRAEPMGDWKNYFITLQPNRNRSRLLIGQTQEWLSRRTWTDQSASFSDECQIPSG
jgi:hypothetical protein